MAGSLAESVGMFVVEGGAVACEVVTMLWPLYEEYPIVDT